MIGAQQRRRHTILRWLSLFLAALDAAIILFLLGAVLPKYDWFINHIKVPLPRPVRLVVLASGFARVWWPLVGIGVIALLAGVEVLDRRRTARLDESAADPAEWILALLPVLLILFGFMAIMFIVGALQSTGDLVGLIE